MLYPVTDLLRPAVAELRLRLVDVEAIHDPLLVMQVRRDGQENGGLGSGDLLYDCLLYTSPSPRDLSTSLMPSSA